MRRIREACFSSGPAMAIHIGRVEGNWGDLKMFEGQDWLP